MSGSPILQGGKLIEAVIQVLVNDSIPSINYLQMPYMGAFRSKTIYLSEKIPSEKVYILYTEYSYILSMVNKIINKEIIGCDVAFEKMKSILVRDKTEILKLPQLTELETKTLHLITG